MSWSSYWNGFKNSQPGHRFQDFYEKRQQDRQDGNIWRRVLFVGLGLCLSIGGIILLGMPGPGLLVIALGLALVAGESRRMARALDWLEPLLRRIAHGLKIRWQALRPIQRGLSIAAAVVLIFAAAGGLYLMVQ